MAYDFGSDVVLDAIRAAGAGPNLPQLQHTNKSAGVVPRKEMNEAKFKLPPATSLPEHEAKAETYRRFEAAVLTTFIQSMLPKEDSEVFGKGLAGDMWRSQMAEKIADQMADRGGVGIAASLMKDYLVDGEQVIPISGVRDPVSERTFSQAGDKATSLIQAVQINTFLKSEAQGTERVSDGD